MVQMGIFIGGGLIAHYLIPEISHNSWSELIHIASSAGKTNFFSIIQPGLPSFLIYWSIYSRDSTTNETDPFSPSIPFCECFRTFECTFPTGIYNETPQYNPGGAYIPQPPPR